MKTTALVFLLLILWTAGNILLKRGIDQAGELDLSLATLWRLALNPSVIAAVFVSGVAFLGWIGLLSRMELSVAAYASSLVYLFLLVGARLFLDESITPLKVVGVTLITLGVLCVTMEQRRADATSYAPTKPAGSSTEDVG